MLAEMGKTKEKLGEHVGTTSLDEIKVHVPIQLDILTNGVGVARGRAIHGLGYGPRRESIPSSNFDRSISDSNAENKVVKLTKTVEKLLRHIKHMEGQLTTFKGYNVHQSSDDDEDGDEHGDEDDEGHGDEDEEGHGDEVFSLYFFSFN